MDGKRFLDSIRMTNLLSFGPDGAEIALEPLNVLIGPNASGKSNLIEAISLLKAAPTNLAERITQGGGIAEWLWKGDGTEPVAAVEVVASATAGEAPLRYRLAFTKQGYRAELRDERIEIVGETSPEKRFLYRYEHGKESAEIRMRSDGASTNGERLNHTLAAWHLTHGQSILAQFKDPRNYPEMTALGRHFSQIRLYADWALGRSTPARLPQQADLPGDFLDETAANLALVLNDLQSQPEVKRLILDKLRHVYEDLEDITTRVQGGLVQVLFHEKGLRSPFLASRVSDGTLRYLCLLTILCHPTPPPLVCIEEPELGLHMDMLPTIADLLIDAAQRTQLIVTTHSDILVNALGDVPEAVLVCERDSGGTRLQRLDPERLRSWLNKYTLGELWSMGEIGGRRW